MNLWAERKSDAPGASGGASSQAPLYRVARFGPQKFARARAAAHTLYVVDAVVPPRPVQLVWKNWPRGRSTRS